MEQYGDSLLRSTDGGSTWARPQQPPPSRQYELRAVAASGSRRVAVGQSVFVSTDGGDTWRDTGGEILPSDGSTRPTFERVAITTDAADEIVRMVMVGRSYEWDGAIAYSADGGETWQEASVDLEGDYFRGVAGAGSRFVAISDGDVRLSTDGGATWTSPQNRPDTEEGLSAVVWTGARFVTIDWSGTAFYSDSGATWEQATLDVPSSSAWTPFAPTAFAGTEEHLVAMGAGRAIRSVDGGVSWSPVDDPLIAGTTWTDLTWTGTQFVAVSTSGRIITSPDGAAWATAVQSLTTAPLSCVASAGTAAVAVGLAGTIVRSRDGGLTWSALATPSWMRTTSGVLGLATVGIAGSHLLAGGTTFVGGAATSAFASSSDGGDSWTPAAGSVAVDSQGLDLTLAGESAIAVSARGIFRSTDQGATWSTVSKPAKAMSDVAANGSRVVAVGRGGAVQYSSDGGATWKASMQTETTSELKGVAWMGSTALAVGEKWTVLRSTDDGATWSKLAVPVALQQKGLGYLSAIACAPTRCAVLVDRRAILESSDAGTSWAFGQVPERGFTDSDNGLLTALTWNGTRFIAVGNTGMILTMEP